MALKQDGVNFVLCPKQGNKIEGFSHTGYVFKDFFLPKQGQGFKPSATHLYPNIGRVVEYPLPLPLPPGVARVPPPPPPPPPPGLALV